MSRRYIDADKLAKTYMLKGKDKLRLATVINELELAPTEDVVAVVRCKDCKYWQDNNNGYPHDECRWGKEETPNSDDYCSFGERRANDGT